MNRRYPASLFLSGFFGDFVFRYFYLFLPSLILLIVGIWVKMCLAIGIALLVIDIAMSLINQLNIRKATLENDNPEFAAFQDAILSENWAENIKYTVERKVESYSETEE